MTFSPTGGVRRDLPSMILSIVMCHLTRKRDSDTKLGTESRRRRVLRSDVSIVRSIAREIRQFTCSLRWNRAFWVVAIGRSVRNLCARYTIRVSIINSTSTRNGTVNTSVTALTAVTGVNVGQSVVQ